MYLRKFILLSLFMAVPLSSIHADSEDGGTSSPFSLGAGGRIISMGGTAAAVWGGSYTLLWNPAGLYAVERSEVNIFHTELFDESTSYSSILASYPFLDLGVVSLGALQLRIGGIDRRDSDNRSVGGELTNKQTRYVLGFARNIYRGLMGGLNLKLDRFAQGAYAANGFGMDAGFGLKSNIRSPAVDGMGIGASVVNLLEPTINVVNQEAGDPRGIRFGVSFWRSIYAKMNDRLLLAVDFDKAKYSETHLHIGGEYNIHGLFSIRGGWDAGIPTFGCGIMVRSILFDYAFRSTELGNNHLFSISYRFGASRSEKLDERRKRREMEIREELDAQIGRFEDRFVNASLMEGEKCMKEGSFEAAIDHFQKVLLWSPENERAKRGKAMAGASFLAARGDSLVQGGRFAEALFIYREAYGDMKLPVIGEKIVMCESQVEQAVDRRKMAGNILSRALELYTEREWVEAVRGFENVLDLDPGNELASSYLQRARARIREAYERVLANADRLITEKRYGAALEAIRTGLEDKPGDGALEQKLALVMELRESAAARQQERKEQRRKAADISQEETDELRMLHERGVEHFKLGEFSKAISMWEKVWRRLPQFEKVGEYLVKAYTYRGMELYSSHLYNEALDVWGKVLEVDPDNEKALRYINRTKEELAQLRGLTG